MREQAFRRIPNRVLRLDRLMREDIPAIRAFNITRTGTPILLCRASLSDVESFAHPRDNRKSELSNPDRDQIRLDRDTVWVNGSYGVVFLITTGSG